MTMTVTVRKGKRAVMSTYWVKSTFLRKHIVKLNIQKTKMMALGHITSWQTEGEKAEAVADFLFLDSKITTDSECSHEIKRCSLLGRKAMTNLDSVLKAETSFCRQRSV